MKKPIILTALFSVLILCVTQAQYILTMHFDEMDLYIGKTVEVRVVETSTGDEVGRKTISTLDTTAFSIQLYVLLEDQDYTIDIHADVNGNGSYDSPPADHAWRRTIIDASQNVVIHFIPDMNYTNTGFPDAFPYSVYESIWGGKWMNFTFGSTDSIMAEMNLSCDSVSGSFTTKGVFGNPNTVSFDYADARPSGEGDDTIRFSPDPPWTGEITIVDDELEGNISTSGAFLVFTGTVGAQQIMALYIVIFAGDTIANGFFYVKELEVVNSAPEISIGKGGLTGVTCFDGDNGAISISVEGGVPGYTYLWSNGDTTAQIFDLVAGDYSVTVTDSMGCTEEASFTIIQPEQMVTTWFTQQVSCNGLCDGSIDLIMIGGTPPYTYLWENGLSTPDAFNLCAGTIWVTVTDALGCVASAPITVFEPDTLIVTVETTDALCFGTCSGTVTHTISGGTPPYSFMDQNDLCAGSYATFVMDANGCLVSTPVVISEPDSLSLAAIEILDETNGQANGSITVEADGGVPPYRYSINGAPLQTSNVFPGLSEGTFTVDAINQNGCIVSVNIILFNLTGLRELRANFQWYPNPASTFIYVESDTPLDIDFYDVQHKLIKEEKQVINQPVFVEDLFPGTYFMKISDGTGIGYSKVIIQ